MSGKSKIILSIITVLVLVGLSIASYLTWTTWNASAVAGCSGDGLIDCDHVLASKWSKWLGQPVSLLGAMGYLGMLVGTAWTFLSSRKLPLLVLAMFAMMAAGSALWFIGLQAFVLKHFCMYCMGVHTCSLLICGLTMYLIYSRDETDEYPMHSMLGIPTDEPEASVDGTEGVGAAQMLAAGGVASVGLLVLVLGQFFYQPPGLVLEEVSIEADQDVVQNDIENETSTDSDNITTDSEVAQAAPDVNAEIENSNLLPAESSFADAESAEAVAKEDDFDPLFDDDPTDGNPQKASQEDLFAEQVDTSLLSESSQTKSSGPRLIKYGPFKDPIDVTKLPIMGNPDAEHILVEMLDYTCPHCRKLHPHVHDALERYGDQLAFVIIHVPLSKKCNPLIKRDHYKHKNACEYARMALGIWELDREKFAEYHEWLMEEEKPPTTGEAKRRAMDLVGEEVLIDDSLQAAAFRNFAGNSQELQNLQTGLPVIVTQKGRVRGIPNTKDEWFDFLEKLLDIKPIDATAS